jgi:hypothetical protein
MRFRWLLTHGPDNEPMWVRLYVHQIGEAWAAMIVADEALPPGSGELKGTAFLGRRLKQRSRRRKPTWDAPSR